MKVLTKSSVQKLFQETTVITFNAVINNNYSINNCHSQSFKAFMYTQMNAFSWCSSFFVCFVVITYDLYQFYCYWNNNQGVLEALKVFKLVPNKPSTHYK